MQTIYVDTSVFGGCFEDEFAKYSNRLLDEFKKGNKKMMLSGLVVKELQKARKEVKKQMLSIPSKHIVTTQIPLKAYLLAHRYIAEGVLGTKSTADAIHVATATLQNADMVASWNFKHMVNPWRIRIFNEINKDMGYRSIVIKTPQHILNSIL